MKRFLSFVYMRFSIELIVFMLGNPICVLQQKIRKYLTFLLLANLKTKLASVLPGLGDTP